MTQHTWRSIVVTWNVKIRGWTSWLKRIFNFANYYFWRDIFVIRTSLWSVWMNFENFGFETNRYFGRRKNNVNIVLKKEKIKAKRQHLYIAKSVFKLSSEFVSNSGSCYTQNTQTHNIWSVQFWNRDVNKIITWLSCNINLTLAKMILDDVKIFTQ